MGNQPSATAILRNGDSKLNQPVRSHNSYFGQNTELGDINTNDLESTIRDLHMERFYRSNPNYRPSFEDGRYPSDNSPSSNAGQPIQLKSVISVTNPRIVILKGNIYVINFELKSEAPGRIVLSSNGVINSISFDITTNNKNKSKNNSNDNTINANENKTNNNNDTNSANKATSDHENENANDGKIRVSLPLPFLADFSLEINPDIEKARTQLDAGFQFVGKHLLMFKISQSDDFKIVYAEQRLTTAELDDVSRTVSVAMNQTLSIENYSQIIQSIKKSNNNNETNSVANLIDLNETENNEENKNVNNDDEVRDEDDVCLICLGKKADTAIADCGHKVICDDCLCGKAVRIHHCPICNRQTSF